MLKNFFWGVMICGIGVQVQAQTGQAGSSTVQQHLARVDQMPDLPKPLQVIDYRAMARRFDSTVFDFTARGDFWPMVWWDSSGKNFSQPVVGMYTAVGDVRQGPAYNRGMFHEALASMGAVLGASLVGIDKSDSRGLNYVRMLKNYFNRETGWNIMMNNTCPEVALLGGGYGRDWWYDVYPNVLYYAICDRYPAEPGLGELAHSIAEKFYQADSILQGNYDWSYFDYGKMKPMKTAICAQPDVAAGHAWVLYSAYKRFGDPRYLRGAVSAMNALQGQRINPTYEVLMPFGAYLAARLNAELPEGTLKAAGPGEPRAVQVPAYDVRKMLDWSFDGTAVCREGWGVLVGNWNGMDISGIVGSTVDHGGYGFLMNTYDAAWPLVPMVRYDPSWAQVIGKWLLNAANAARFFYPQYMPREHQTIPERASVTRGVIAYEGIIRQSGYKAWEGLQGPVAQGDGPLWVPGKNPEESQFSVYGSGHAGIFGSIIRTTEVPGILQADLLATDFYREEAYPSYLLFNPYGEVKKVTLKWEDRRSKARLGGKVDLYNTVTGRFIARGVGAEAPVVLQAKEAAVIVCVPAGGKVSFRGKVMLVNGVVAGFKNSFKQKTAK